MQFAVPGVTGEDLSALKAWYWSDELSLDPQAAIFHIEVRSYLLERRRPQCAHRYLLRQRQGAQCALGASTAVTVAAKP